MALCVGDGAVDGAGGHALRQGRRGRPQQGAKSEKNETPTDRGLHFENLS
jgi:hypothetical protein